MADKKISQLVDGGPPQATDEFVIDRASLDNFKLDWASLKTDVLTNVVEDGDAAGGDLAGTYPNPTFAVDMATQAELNAVVAAAVMDGDAAGGVLSGTYPNPGFAVDMATQAELDAAVFSVSEDYANTFLLMGG